MDKSSIIGELQTAHREFVDYVNGMSEMDFTAAPENKWTAGQQLEHIYLSVKPVAMALSLPKLAPRLLFGKANRTSRSYDEVVAKYQAKLNAGGKAPSSFVPKPVGLERKSAIAQQVDAQVAKLIKGINSYSEKQLDQLLLPHPLLGKMTIREMLMFTLYHVRHHHESLKTATLS
ncbi:MAG: DinB family protein [Chitinophagales bacterium]|nr:DinB family protein [Chitinophagales bacterium]